MPFKKGQSGNPKGRPPLGNTIADAFRQVLETKGEDGRLNREKFAQSVFDLAMAGDMQASKLLANYLDGMPTQRVEQTGADGSELKVSFSLQKQEGQE